jgi:hypothetical protein
MADAERMAAPRSAVTSGNTLFVLPVDGRTSEARRFRDIRNQLVADLGGDDMLGEGQRQLVRRVALLSWQCEMMEARAVVGEPLDLDQYGQLVDRLGRALQRIGLQRVARPAAPGSLEEHFSRPPTFEAAE